jgi:glycolate oxidase FAD binding subunit
MERAEECARGANARVMAHAANGVVRMTVRLPDAVAGIVGVLRPVLEARGGSFVVERASPAVKASLDVWGEIGPSFPLMRRVKEAFDPAGILAPGRFVGGL